MGAVLLLTVEVTADLMLPELLGSIVDDGVLRMGLDAKTSFEAIYSIGLSMCAITFIGWLSGCFNSAFLSCASQRTGNAMRKDCFRRIMSLSFHQAKRYGAGTLITRMTNDITQVQGFVSQVLRGLVRTVLLTVGGLFFLFRLHAKLGLMALVAMPFLVGIIYLCLRRAHPLFKRLQEQLDRLNDIMQEDVAGVRTIKACVREAYEKMRFGTANRQLIATQLSILFIFALMNPAVHFVLDITIAFYLLWGHYQVSQGGISPGVIMASIIYVTTVMHGLLLLVMVFQNIVRGAASWRRIREILTVEPELSEGTQEGNPEQRGKVEFKGVTFAYPDGDLPILRNINLTVNPGETVAIMGSTGCGKTSLLNLIPRFYEVSAGQVLVAGCDVREYRLHALRSSIAYALQQTELFSDTIAANVAWGKEACTAEELEQAAAIAQASSFIEAKEAAWDEVLDERGNSLSGGQKQRLAITRAVLKDADILLFDDATSALDLATEARLAQALQESRPGCTKIIVAQRVASARRCDRIVVLEKGEIVGDGTHRELLQNCPTYAAICQSQLGGEDDAA